METITFRNLCQSVVGNNVTTMYTATNLTFITQGVAINTSAGTVTLNIWIDIDGTSSTDAEAIWKAFELETGDAIPLKNFIEKMVIGVGGTIKAQASVSSAITLTISGSTIS